MNIGLVDYPKRERYSCRGAPSIALPCHVSTASTALADRSPASSSSTRPVVVPMVWGFGAISKVLSIFLTSSTADAIISLWG